MRFSGELVGRGDAEAADPVDGVGQPVVGLQRAGKELEQSPGQSDTEQVADHQDSRCLEQRATAHLGRELVIGQYQNGDGGDMERQTQEFADIFESAAVVLNQRGDVESDRDHQDDHQHPPGDALLGRQCPGHDGKRDGPREAGIGEVEQIVVDEVPRHPGQVPDGRRDAGQ